MSVRWGVACTDALGTWGSTPEERADAYPCDTLVERPDIVVFRAVDVAAPAATMFRWLCQLRVAPYSYDWIDNFGRRSPRELIDGLEHLEVGQTVATIFRLVSFEPDRSITLDSTTSLFGRVVITYRVAPVDPDRCRLVAKVLCLTPRNPVGVVMRWILPAGDLLMMRRQLLTLRDLAEQTGREGYASPRTSPLTMEHESGEK